MQKTRHSKSIQSITRAVSVLNSLSLNICKVSDISRHLNLSVATVYRLLQTLQENGLVIQDSLNREYYLGHRLLTLTSDPFVTHRYLINIATSKMEFMRKITGETVSLYVGIGLNRIRLLRLMGEQSVSYIGKPNTINPIWLGSTGKVLLSQLSKDELEVIFKNIQLEPLTPTTITDKPAFEKEIAVVKQRGYGTSINEETMGVASLSVPIWNYAKPVALTIVGPYERFGIHMMDYFGELKNKSREISEELIRVRMISESNQK
jgi:DNA-binding IclR family transcriptional regulator